MLQNLRPIEIILLIAIVLLLFGAKKLPDAARGIGQSLKIFRKELRSEEDPAPAPKMARSEERRVGKESRSQGREDHPRNDTTHEQDRYGADETATGVS